MTKSGVRPSRAASIALSVVVLSLALAVTPVRADEEPEDARPSATSVLARQSLGGFGGGGGLGSPLFGWFDRDRLTWNQSFQFGFSSGSGYSGPAGLYTSSFGYRIANPLNLKVDLGAHYTPGAARFSNPQATAGLFVQGVTLDWRPAANSLIRFSYQDYRSPLQQGFGWNDPYYAKRGWAPVTSPDDPSFEPASGN